MKQAHIFISGFVQGVGFRHSLKKEAQKLGLTGWARNTPDNRVEAVFQTEAKENIEKMIGLCKKGPFLSEVEDVAVQWEEAKEKFDTFQIIL